MTRLTQQAVLDFGSSMLARVLGDDYDGTVMLAGGAFKTRLHGRPPRDLDLWAADTAAREKLIDRLCGRGARRLTATQYTEAFDIAGTLVEVPRKADRTDIQVHFRRVDIGIAAVAVQLADGKLRAAVHPLALECELRREVLFMKPLANWRHCLACLARARRYALELGWQLPTSEEDYIWTTFDAQTPEMQQCMIERGEATAVPDKTIVVAAHGRMQLCNEDWLRTFGRTR